MNPTHARCVAALLLVCALFLMACGDGDNGQTPLAAATSPAGQTPTTAGGQDYAKPTETAAPGGEQPVAPTQPGQAQQPTEPSPTPIDAIADTPTAPPDPAPEATATPEPRLLTAEDLERYQPNEMGQIPILQYHHIGEPAEQFVRTPDQFRADLQWLYDNNFYVVNLHDIIDDRLDVPLGKRPVALTFDDSPASQFSLIPLPNGQFSIDPDSAIGIMEDFFARHPDFGRGGHFAVLPYALFDWGPWDYAPQSEYAELKLRWLLDNGYELGNHTVDHANLSLIDDDEIMYQLAVANDLIEAIVPDADVRVITLPYGMYPPGGDDTLFYGFEYEGRYYEWDAALLVGANPTVVPISTEYHKFEVARIQAFDEELHRWFEVFEANPGILYVSDGNPNTVTVPHDLHPWIAGTLDETKIGDRELIRY
jgi:peptidoglycan/xylan/chitin deacetylase (PgdA/CDA1 family)